MWGGYGHSGGHSGMNSEWEERIKKCNIFLRDWMHSNRTSTQWMEELNGTFPKSE